MRISDWSSDVCSSDLGLLAVQGLGEDGGQTLLADQLLEACTLRGGGLGTGGEAGDRLELQAIAREVAEGVVVDDHGGALAVRQAVDVLLVERLEPCAEVCGIGGAVTRSEARRVG